MGDWISNAKPPLVPCKHNVTGVCVECLRESYGNLPLYDHVDGLKRDLADARRERDELRAECDRLAALAQEAGGDISNAINASEKQQRKLDGAYETIDTYAGQIADARREVERKDEALRNARDAIADSSIHGACVDLSKDEPCKYVGCDETIPIKSPRCAAARNTIALIDAALAPGTTETAIPADKEQR